ncbi:hypothetical protein BDP27DRAFT_1538724 [Rhodocollybia butyracea]|uniref:chitin deacetylase n=1 Tax=Rhodocollybia butyracea TaxID=206335 RepID=A0A9P5PPF1_9AGAR|nr:hypothetical protein BDP27DRAFT_1538724 [Rhodocollybia butyracea]
MQSSLRKLSSTFIIASLLRLSFTDVRVQSAALDRSSEAAEAAITNPREECTPYGYAPVYTQLNKFPEVWEAASILPNDQAARAKWNSISGSIPTNIPVKSLYPFWSTNFLYLTLFFTITVSTYCWWTYDLCTTPKLAGLAPDITAAPEPLTLGYGFDDGPNCSHNIFYDYLESQNQKATFYFIGSNVADWPLEAQRALVDGHEICAHTWSHPYMTTFTSEDAFAELWYSMQMIKLVVGVTPTCWRPPYGDVDDRIRSIAKGLGLQTIMWKYDSEDADVDGSDITHKTVVRKYNDFIKTAESGTFNSGGAIFLTHELNNFTMSTAVDFYPQLKSVFKHLVPVGVSLNKTRPYVETNYALPTFEQYISGTLTVNSNIRILPNSSSSTSSSTSSDATLPSSSNTASVTTTSSNAASAMNMGRENVLFLLSLGLIYSMF